MHIRYFESTENYVAESSAKLCSISSLRQLYPGFDSSANIHN